MLADIDTYGDRTISEAEQRAYAERVRRDLSLPLDSIPVAKSCAPVRYAAFSNRLGPFRHKVRCPRLPAQC